MLKLVIQTIKNRHELFLRHIEQHEDVELSLVYSFLNDLVRAGNVIEQSSYRSLIRSLIRFWAAYVSDKTNDYPLYTLMDFGQYSEQVFLLPGQSEITMQANEFPLGETSYREYSRQDLGIAYNSIILPYTPFVHVPEQDDI